MTNIVSRGSKILARRLLCSMREIKKRVCARRVQEIHVYIGCYVSARISSVRRVSSHIFTKNFENIERETFFSVDSCRQFPPSYVSCFPRVLRPGSPFLFPALVVVLLFFSSSLFTCKSRLRDFHRLYQFRFPLFKVARYLVLDPPTLSSLYLFRAITV